MAKFSPVGAIPIAFTVSTPSEQSGYEDTKPAPQHARHLARHDSQYHISSYDDTTSTGHESKKTGAAKLPTMNLSFATLKRHDSGGEDIENLGFEQFSPVSPLSPTFGPRRNEVFSGTVSRRRSVQISPISPLETSFASRAKNKDRRGSDHVHDSVDSYVGDILQTAEKPLGKTLT